MGKILERQFWHFLSLLLLLCAVAVVIGFGGFLQGGIFGVSTAAWFYLSIAVPIVHQAYMLIAWRMELYRGSITGMLGKNGFYAHVSIFLILVTLRVLTITVLAVSNRHTIDVDSSITYGLGILISIPVVYSGYSILRYLGIKRAAGIDHFDKSYGSVPFVRQGIFRFTSNGIYVFGMLVLWIPGVLLASKAAVLAALFSHVYIWVHYYCTEKPDIEAIYGKNFSGAKS